MASVADKWRRQHGRAWTEAEFDEIYHDLIPLQLAAIERHSAVIDGVLPCVAELHRRGIHVAGTTGYFRTAAAYIFSRRSKVRRSHGVDAARLAAE